MQGERPYREATSLPNEISNNFSIHPAQSSGINVYADQDAIEKNIEILAEQLGPYGQTTVTSTVLDSKNYSMQHYNARVSRNGSNDFVLVVGPYSLDWIGQNGDIQKISKLVPVICDKRSVSQW